MDLLSIRSPERGDRMYAILGAGPFCAGMVIIRARTSARKTGGGAVVLAVRWEREAPVEKDPMNEPALAGKC